MTDSTDALSQQLPLQVSLPEDARLDSLFGEPNTWFLNWLESDWLAGRELSLFVQAPAGGGLTHLLQAICRQGEDVDRAVFYLSLQEVEVHGPAVLEGMSDMPLLCLDDLHTVLGQPAWDEALFHLFNEMRAQQHQLVLGSHVPLAELRATVLPDLHSRLSWGMVVTWKLPDDAGWQRAIHWLAQQRGLHITPDTARYLALRGPRDWAGMAALIQQLDRKALAAQRRLTQPFIRQVMGW